MFDPSAYGEAVAAFKQDAARRYPEEACGFLTADGYVPCRNIAVNPYTSFEIDPATFVRVNAKTPVIAVLHSHPDGDIAPSSADMAGQMGMALPWGVCAVTKGGADDVIFWGDQCPIAPLIGRQFVSGVWDCYTLVRDYFRLKGITFADIPRDYEWWKGEDGGPNLYDKHWASQGFREVDVSEVREGDCFMLRIRSTVTNHAGVYVGDGLVLHHLQARLSRRDPVNMWAPKIVRWVRHESMEG